MNQTKSKEIDSAHIIEAALALFAEKGLHGVTVRAIANRADVDTAKIYRLFGSKDLSLIHI